MAGSGRYSPGGGSYGGGSGSGSGWGYSSGLGYYTVFMDPENNPYIIVIEGRVGWLKQMFSVSLILANTSEETGWRTRRPCSLCLRVCLWQA